MDTKIKDLKITQFVPKKKATKKNTEKYMDNYFNNDKWFMNYIKELNLKNDIKSIEK